MSWSMIVLFYIQGSQHLANSGVVYLTHLPPPRPPVIFDMISVGSNTRHNLTQMQSITFGSHPVVRHFFIYTEADDSEGHCHTNLTLESVKFISNFCRKSNHRQESRRFRSRYASVPWLEKKDNPTGWMCAIKRPAESLFHTIGKYRYQRRQLAKDDNIEFPDYLFLLDDDTYLNTSQMITTLPSLYPSNESYAVAGCMIRERFMEHNFTFPWGGFGTIFTRALLEKFQHPINCSTTSTADDNSISYLSKVLRELTLPEFEKLVCHSLSKDILGETFLFHDGMSVADLMYAYVTNWEYTNAEMHWLQNEPGFCMHADWVIGYFVNSYYLAKHTGDYPFTANTNDRFRGYFGSQLYAGKRPHGYDPNMKQCYNDGDENCLLESHFCHHVTPQKMKNMNSLQSVLY
jgi:hypothetical protein